MESASYYFDEYGRMTNPPDGSYVPTSNGTGSMFEYIYDANGMRKTKTVTTGNLVAVLRNGLHWADDGELRYYVDGQSIAAGLKYIDGHYYYFKTSGAAVRSTSYWITYNNGLMPSANYTFDEYGRMTNPPEDKTVAEDAIAMSPNAVGSAEVVYDWAVDTTNATVMIYNYVYNGGSLVQMTVGSDVLNFAYDASGSPMAVTWNGTTYLYVTNVQGDVIAISDTSGNAVVKYTYDAWGNILSITGTMTDTLGVLNPLTYRGYVYDHDTGLYYLQSRYYNPQWGRFLNADVYTSTGQGLLGNNMFAYCLNNPVNMCDQLGASAKPISYVAFGDTSTMIVFAKKGQKDWVPKTNRPKDSDKRRPTGERERNKKHPNGEEHSRNPKGNGRHLHHCEYSPIPQYVYFEDYQVDFFDKGTGTICYTSQLSTINYLTFDASNDLLAVTFVPLLAVATTIMACMFTEDVSHRTGWYS